MDLITKKYGSLYLKDVGFPLAVDACECSTDGSTDSPNVLDEFGVTRKDGLIIQLKEIYTYEEEHGSGSVFRSAFKEFQILQQDNPQSFHEWVLKSDFGSVFKMTANMYSFIVYFLKKHILFSLSKSSFSI